MANSEPPVHVDGKDARAGASTHVTRYILPISLVLVIAIFAVLLLR
ncbi:regulator [Sphingomonas sp. Leaf17]|nr:hypothetical protein [Sphingomonas sp. Leaf17]KQM67704.1 regulator [Sphingomonas sp. Leaf17]